MKINLTKSVLLKRVLYQSVGVLTLVFLMCFGHRSMGQSQNPPMGVCAAIHQYSNTNPCINTWSFAQVGLNGWTHSMTCQTGVPPYRYWNTQGNIQH